MNIDTGSLNYNKHVKVNNLHSNTNVEDYENKQSLRRTQRICKKIVDASFEAFSEFSEEHEKKPLNNSKQAKKWYQRQLKIEVGLNTWHCANI